MKFALYLTLPLFALDQFTKWLVLRHIGASEVLPVIPGWFDLVHVTNTGAAFGSFRGNNLFFIILKTCALGLISVLLLRPHPKDTWRDLSLALLLAGVLGNLTDRLLHGHVIDFLLFDLHVPFANPFAAFNVADASICVAVICFIIHSLMPLGGSRRIGV